MFNVPKNPVIFFFFSLQETQGREVNGLVQVSGSSLIEEMLTMVKNLFSILFLEI